MSTQTASTGEREQRLHALRRANDVRVARSQLRHKIATGEIFAASVLLHPPPEAQSWPVSELLMSQRRWGVNRCRKFLWRHRINEIKPVAELTERQRAILARALEREGKR